MGVLLRKQVNICGAERWVQIGGSCEPGCYPQPVAPVISASLQSVCGGQSAVLSANTGQGDVVWYRDGIPTTVVGISMTTNLSGTYTARRQTVCGLSEVSNPIVLTYSPDCDCEPQPLVPTITVSQNNICEEQTATIIAFGGSGIIAWFKDGNRIPNLVGSSITVSETGDYKAISITTCGESASSNIVNVQYSPECGCEPQPSTPVISASNLFLCPGELSTLTALGGCMGIVKWYNSAQPTVVIGTGATILVGTGTYFARCETECGVSSVSNNVIIEVSPNCGGGGGCFFQIGLSTVNC